MKTEFRFPFSFFVMIMCIFGISLFSLALYETYYIAESPMLVILCILLILWFFVHFCLLVVNFRIYDNKLFLTHLIYKKHMEITNIHKVNIYYIRFGLVSYIIIGTKVNNMRKFYVRVIGGRLQSFEAFNNYMHSKGIVVRTMLL